LVGFGGNGGPLVIGVLVGLLVLFEVTLESLSDLLLNNLIFADTRPIVGEEGEDILHRHCSFSLVKRREKKRE
jgi:hypothetical protein